MATITMTVLNGLSVIEASASEAWNSDAPVHRNINEWNLSYFPHVVGTSQDNFFSWYVSPHISSWSSDRGDEVRWELDVHIQSHMGCHDPREPTSRCVLDLKDSSMRAMGGRWPWETQTKSGLNLTDQHWECNRKWRERNSHPSRRTSDGPE